MTGQLLQIAQGDGICRGLAHGQLAIHKSDFIVPRGQAGDGDLILAHIAVLLVGIAVNGLAGQDAFDLVLDKSGNVMPVIGGLFAVGDVLVPGSNGQGSLGNGHRIGGGGLRVLIGNSGGGDGDHRVTGAHDGDSAGLGVHLGHSGVAAGIGQRAAAGGQICSGVIEIAISVGFLEAGSGDHNSLLFQLGDGFGLGLAAAGAGEGLDALRIQRGQGGDDAIAPVMAQSVHIGILVAVTAAGAGVGGVALRRTGGGGDRRGIAMAQGGDSLRGFHLAAGAGMGPGASFGAGGFLGHGPVAPDVFPGCAGGAAAFTGTGGLLGTVVGAPGVAQSGNDCLLNQHDIADGAMAALAQTGLGAGSGHGGIGNRRVAFGFNFLGPGGAALGAGVGFLAGLGAGGLRGHHAITPVVVAGCAATVGAAVDMDDIGVHRAAGGVEILRIYLQSDVIAVGQEIQFLVILPAGPEVEPVPAPAPGILPGGAVGGELPLAHGVVYRVFHAVAERGLAKQLGLRTLGSVSDVFCRGLRSRGIRVKGHAGD